jgi:anti-sigma factor RsiW
MKEIPFALKVHVQTCERCREQLHMHEELMAILSKSPAAQLSPGFSAITTRRAIANSTRRRRSLRAVEIIYWVMFLGFTAFAIVLMPHLHLPDLGAWKPWLVPASLSLLFLADPVAKEIRHLVSRMFPA